MIWFQHQKHTYSIKTITTLGWVCTRNQASLPRWTAQAISCNPRRIFLPSVCSQRLEELDPRPTDNRLQWSKWLIKSPYEHRLVTFSRRQSDKRTWIWDFPAACMIQWLLALIKKLCSRAQSSLQAKSGCKILEKSICWSVAWECWCYEALSTDIPSIFHALCLSLSVYHPGKVWPSHQPSHQLILQILRT